MTSASLLRTIFQHHAALLGSAQGLSSLHLPKIQSLRSYFSLTSGGPNDYYNAYPRGEYHATTILCVRKEGKVVLIGDGQVQLDAYVALILAPTLVHVLWIKVTLMGLITSGLKTRNIVVSRLPHLIHSGEAKDCMKKHARVLLECIVQNFFSIRSVKAR
jgi:hypothetical protein